MESTARIAALHRRLVEEPDAALRAEAHMELGRLALDQRRPDLAIRHFKEALLLQPGLERAREALRALGEYSRTRERSVLPAGRGRQALRELFKRIRGA